MTESLKLLKRFTVLCMLLLCFIAMLCGGAVVDRNTRQLALGESKRQVGFSLDRETTTIMTGRQTVTWPTASPALRRARYAPAPLGTLVMIGECFSPPLSLRDISPKGETGNS